ncbi:hypothetical protein TIFTF001_035032 [Ficus carica]|uniref:Uncharacterized protein n=1 Tax=Ficus carica TaxID=3494 RepID=A0AA88E9A8_FICCA|nr:hypothetical protein TIFTF001_035032 [Ficus carica]
MMASKLPRVVPTCHKGGFGPWFELDWTGHPNHSMTAHHGKQPIDNLDTRRWGLARRDVKRGMETATSFVILCYYL